MCLCVNELLYGGVRELALNINRREFDSTLFIQLMQIKFNIYFYEQKFIIFYIYYYIFW